MDFEGADKAVRAIAANMSPRYRRLEALEKWVDGTQYVGRPDWFTGGKEEVPLWERAPCVVYPVVQVAIGSNTDLVFGEGRFPEISSKPGEDEADEDNGLDEEQSATLDRYLREYHRLCHFTAHCRDVFDAAQGCGTGIGIHGHREGRPFAEQIPAKWGTPKFKPDQRTLESIEIRYPYLEEYRQPIELGGKWAVRAKLYRRVIDEKNDVTYFPADADEQGREPSWEKDPARTVPHNLGFCPVIWYPFMRGCVPINVVDGKAIHALLTDEIQQHDIAYAQWHRCNLYAEPQMCEIGVTPGFNPTDVGQMPTVPATEFGGSARRGDTVGEERGVYTRGGGSKPARKKGPGYVNQYPNPETKVEYLSPDAAILKAQEEHCLDLLHKVEDGLCVVLPKPSQFKFAGSVSGKSIEMIRKRQYDRCDKYRDDIEDHFLRPSVEMQLRITARVGKQLKVPGIAKILPILSGVSAKSGDKADADAA